MNIVIAEAVIASGGGLVRNLEAFLIVIVCCLIIWALGRYLGQTFKAPPIALTGWNVVFVCVGAFALLNFLMGLIGHGIIAW